MDTADKLASASSRLAERAGSLVDVQLRRLRGVREYDGVSDVDLRRSLERNVARVVATINQQEELPPQVEEDERATGRRRAMQGIPIESVVDAYRSHLALLRDAFMEEATAIELDPEAVLGGIRRLWDLADHYAGVLTIAIMRLNWLQPGVTSSSGWCSSIDS